MKHGGNFTAAAKAFGFNPAEMIDLSTGIAPRSFPVEGVDLTARHWRDLPQTDVEQALIDAMKTHWHCDSAAEVVLAPGSGVVISLAATLPSKIEVMIPDPVYSEHEIAWAQQGHHVVTYPAGQIPHLTPAAKAIIAVQPGNPTGQINPPQDWLAVIDAMAERGGMVIVDEAFIDIMPEQSLAPMAGRKGLLVIRSFGKFYGLAGVRLGAAIGHRDDIQRLQQLLGPWAVSTLALDLGLKAIADTAWAESQRQWLNQEMTLLHGVLQSAGLAICGGTALYALAEVGDAQALHQHLAQHGLWTRIFDHHPHWMRFGLPATPEERQRLASALKGWRQDGN